MKKLLPLFLLASFTMTSCVTTTSVTFVTDPGDADVFVDHRLAGTTPAQKRLSNGIWNQYRIRVEKDGYKTLNDSLEKEVKVVNLVFGILIWWPSLLWVYGPKPVQHWKLSAVDTVDSVDAVATVKPAKTDARVIAPDTPLAGTIARGEIQRQTISYIERRLQEGLPVRLSVVINPPSNASEVDVTRIRGTHISRLIDTFSQYDDFLVVDRQMTREILKEYEFELSGLVNTDELNQYGRLSGATHLLVIDSNRSEQSSILTVEDRRLLLDVETGAALASDSTVSTFLWESDHVGYRLIRTTHNGYPVRVDNDRLYQIE